MSSSRYSNPPATTTTTNMSKIDSLRRLLLPCFFTPSTSSSSATTTTTTTTTKKRLSTSLRDDIDGTHQKKQIDFSRPSTTDDEEDQELSFSTHKLPPILPPRPSKSMVICTFFGGRKSHVWFCVQIDRLSTKPSLLLELSISTLNLVKEMRTGLVRIALECNRPDLGVRSSCPLHSVLTWTLFCNGRRVGFATRRKASEETRLMLKKMQSMTVGAGVIPPSGSSGLGAEEEEVMYMRANYEWVIGGADSESFHLINPDEGSGQELSIFLMRSG